MQFDKNGFPISGAEPDADASEHRTDTPADETVQAALASISTPVALPKPLPLGEMKWQLTTLLYPSILLIFVALYVTCMGAGAEPEMALLQAGGVSIVLAVLGRIAVSILGDDTRLVLNDSQIVAMARNSAVREYLSGPGSELRSDGAELPSMAAQAARAGGKE